MASSSLASDFTNSGLMIHSMPDFGDYVVFYIDFMASVQFLEDDEAFAAARELAKSTRKYVGFVNSLNYPSEVNLLFHGLPTIDHLQNDNLCASPEMSFPVFPNEAHPLSRMAVKPEPLLPWKDCYHSSFGQAECRVSSDKKDRSKVTTLDGFFRNRILRRGFMDDLYVAREIYAAAAVPLPPSPAGSSASLPAGGVPQRSPRTPASAPLPPGDENATFELGAAESPQFDAQHLPNWDGASITVSCYSSIIIWDEDDDVDEGSDLPAGYLKAMFDIWNNPMDPIIQVNYDLATIDDFDPPSEYFKEEEALRRIIRASLRRQHRREMAMDFGASQGSLIASATSSASESIKTPSSASSYPHHDAGHPSLFTFLKKLLRPL
ncbi:hypothetical protein HGRIS_000671 [Hohenbuehelia grisea]|uniref:Uncharacterized protein n=1 Tax=Hohenbuehelia grisea TaxID=104357 RepID=A0ABR3JT26_9AGAR